jgi:hypothetical protein
LGINDNKNLGKNNNRLSFYPHLDQGERKNRGVILKYLKEFENDVARWTPKITSPKGFCGRVFSERLASVGRRFDGGRSHQMTEDNAEATASVS